MHAEREWVRQYILLEILIYHPEMPRRQLRSTDVGSTSVTRNAGQEDPKEDLEEEQEESKD